MRGEREAAVRRALEQIDDPTDRAILELRLDEGLSLRQTADRLGLNREDVRRRFQRILEQLEHYLKDLL
jgi:RNA polymerase sigma factor (sigma-70 family)